MELQWKQRLFWVTIFGTAMGWFEAVLVVYLRKLYYPDGFGFPIREIPGEILTLELFREVATIVMLIAIGWLAGRSVIERFCTFCGVFGIWDITYYLGLKIAIDWPSSLFEGDLLFLLPVPWTGPVIAPVLVSIALITACIIISKTENHGIRVSPSKIIWFIEIICGLLIILSFTIDYHIVFEKQNIPRFRWELFLPALFTGFVVFLYEVKRFTGKKSTN